MRHIHWYQNKTAKLVRICSVIIFVQLVLTITFVFVFHGETNRRSSRISQVKKQDRKGFIKTKKTFRLAETILGRDRVRNKSTNKVNNSPKDVLPNDQAIEHLYGSSIKINGLETCAKFRQNVKKKDRIIAPAGMFNSGTHLLFELLSENCILDDEQQVQDGVAWGKHIPASWRDKWFMVPTGNQRISKNRKASEVNLEYPYVDKGRVLPIVIAKDPYTWMQSMCRHPYTLKWLHDSDHCPNLVSKKDIDLNHNLDTAKSEEAVVMYRLDSNFTYHSSLVGVWNDWYSDYYHNFRYPRLIIRYEDLLFRPHLVIKDVCDCVDGITKKKFRLIRQSAKGNRGQHQGSKTTLLDAFTRYGNAEKRIKGYTNEDLNYAEKHLNQDLMNVFGYHHPHPTDRVTNDK